MQKVVILLAVVCSYSSTCLKKMTQKPLMHPVFHSGNNLPGVFVNMRRTYRRVILKLVKKIILFKDNLIY